MDLHSLGPKIKSFKNGSVDSANFDFKARGGGEPLLITNEGVPF